MLDFYTINTTLKYKGTVLEVSPRFKTVRQESLMVRGGTFYAVWDEGVGLWSRDEIRVQELVDEDIRATVEKLQLENPDVEVRANYLSGSSWAAFKNYVLKLPDTFTSLDRELNFGNSKPDRKKYASKILPYDLPEEPVPTPAFDKLFGVLYDPVNLEKIMWALGSVISGRSKEIQKFYVLYGLPGTGKSTTLNLIEQLFEGYVATFEAAALASSNNSFPLEAFRENPLVAIDHEGDLSRISTNSSLTSIVSHDLVSMNVKYRSVYDVRVISALFIATNKPVMITDAKSGLLRRMLDIVPTGRIVTADDYNRLTGQICFELGGIARKCLDVFNTLGPTHYNGYVPLLMLYKTNHVFNFVKEHSLYFASENQITLKVAWRMYKEYCDEIGYEHRLNMNNFREQMKDYWQEFHEAKKINDNFYRSLYIGFKEDAFTRTVVQDLSDESDWLGLKPQMSILDVDNADQPAQLGNDSGTPSYKWDNVKTKLRDIDTGKLHYLLPKEGLITIDFDLRDENGEKSLEKNLEAARRFPQTYAEVSKGGSGLHLHYYYAGDIQELENVYSPGIEILKPVGNFSIRRKLTLCNDRPILVINSGLPTKPKGDKMISPKTVANERGLRKLIGRNLRKEIHPATKPSVDFIDTILREAYDSGMVYDVTDLKPIILNFASNSTNNAPYCIDVALKIPYKSENTEVPEEVAGSELVFFDLEVYPNMVILCWKREGDNPVVSMINPSPEEVETLSEFRLVGFNNRRYDNHILYALLLGMNNSQVHGISKRIVSGDRTAYFREAYGISYADVYDFANVKQSLKHWEVELNLPYMEMNLDWDSDLPEEFVEDVIGYCSNDVLATEAVFNARIEDFHAREILAKLSGLTVNDPTLSQASRIIFGNDRNASDKFRYPDLSLEFPGYTYDAGVSTYRGEVVGEGGYVYAVPGMYNNVLYMDITSMHPTSLIQMKLFGPYTERFEELVRARVLIKEGDFDSARKMLGGALSEYLDSGDPKGLSYALKIILNSVYGFTAAKFDNPFRDLRNKDNVVAKRGALFMVDLKHALQERGCNPIHFKTDSVKIADYTQEDVDFVVEFGKKYGYEFQVEGVYDRLCLINDAVLVGKLDDGRWDTVGARFSHPYVFKSIFTKEPIEFEDMVEVRSVTKGLMYIETQEGLSFVGRIGRFCPMKTKGGKLLRIHDEKQYAVTGTKKYLWARAEVVKSLDSIDDIDLGYFEELVEDAKARIKEFGDITIFVGDN